MRVRREGQEKTGIMIRIRIMKGSHSDMRLREGGDGIQYRQILLKGGNLPESYERDHPSPAVTAG